MGKKPVIGLAALWLTSAALVGCQDCQHCGGSRGSTPSNGSGSQQVSSWNQPPNKNVGRAPGGDMDPKAVASQGVQPGAGGAGATTATWPIQPAGGVPGAGSPALDRTPAAGMSTRQPVDPMTAGSTSTERTPAGMGTSQPVDPMKGRTPGSVDGTSNYQGDMQMPSPVINLNKTPVPPAGPNVMVPDLKAPPPPAEHPAPPGPGPSSESSSPPSPEPPPGSEPRMTPPPAPPPKDFVPMPPMPLGTGPTTNPN
jgi:hypothetical protein